MTMTSTVSATGGTSNDKENIVVLSESSGKLRDGLKKAMEHAEALSDKWLEKVKNAELVPMCKKCGRKFKSISGLKSHWRAKKNECKEEDGYNEVPNIDVSIEDRCTPKQLEMERLRIKSDIAAKKITAELAPRHIPEEKFPKAEELYKAHVSKLPDMLKSSSGAEIKKFLAMRFDVNTCTKQHLGVRELSRRAKQGA